MAIKYVVSESEALMKGLSQNIGQAKEIFESLVKNTMVVHQALTSGELQGKTYQSANHYFMKVLKPLMAKGNQIVSDALEDLKTYRYEDRKIAFWGNLDQEKLERDRVILERQKRRTEEEVVLLKQDTLSETTSPYAHRELIRLSEEAVEKTKKDIQKINEQLKALQEFEIKTDALFLDSLSALNALIKVIDSLEKVKIANGQVTGIAVNINFLLLKLNRVPLKAGDKDSGTEWDHAREAFKRQEKEYKKLLEEAFKIRKDGKIVGVKIEKIRQLLKAGNLSETEKQILVFYFHYAVSEFIDSDAGQSLLKNIAKSLGIDLKDYTFKDKQEFKDALEKEAYYTPALNSLLKDGLSFVYDAENDYYYTTKNGIQSNFGFGDNYDYAGPILGMDLDTSIYEFQVGNKAYRFQLWKGTYGSGQAYGAEQGWYVRDVQAKQSATDKIGESTGGKGWLPAAKGKDQIRMVNETYVKDKDGNSKKMIKNDTKKPETEKDGGKHFWNLAIKTDAGYNKSNLYNQGVLYIPDKKVLKALYEQMKQDGRVTELEVNEKEGTLTYAWGK